MKHHISLNAFTLLLCLSHLPPGNCFQPVGLLSIVSAASHLLEHLASPLGSRISLEDLVNTRIPGPKGSDVEILAYTAIPEGGSESSAVIILLHEFFGLNPSIVDKAEGLANDLGCVVVAPDTFRGEVTEFIPRAIWLAISTPQERVNDDLDAVCSFLESGQFASVRKLGKVAVMGFCYRGGKAIRYTIQRRPDAATVVFYGSPDTDVAELRRLQAPVCGVFGSKDPQFPSRLLDAFSRALDDAGIESNVKVYDGVGHAFWKNMEQVREGEEPQTEAYEQCVGFLRGFFHEKRK